MTTTQASSKNVEIIRRFGPDTIASNKNGHSDQGLAKLMFINPIYVKHLLKEMNDGISKDGEKSNRHLYLEALWDRGKRLKIKKLCPYCQEKPVQYFIISGSIRTDKTSCSPPTRKRDCGLKMLPVDQPVGPYIDHYKFIFPHLLTLQERLSKNNFEKVVDLFRWAFGIHYKADGIKLTNENAYKVFKE